MASRLHDAGIAVTTSLAGRTREPAPLKGEVRVGGFGGPEGLASFVRENHITVLADMTHPFAARMSENARQAARLSGITLVAWQRPGWEKIEGDHWFEVADVPAAVAAIPANARVLLALGSQHIAPFANRPDVHFLVRMVDPPSDPLPLPDHELLLAKPGLVEGEFALLRDRQITHVICRNSGGKASYSKIAAARLLGLPVILIGRAKGVANNETFDGIEQKILATLG